jgi:hypothetical protein
MLFSIGSHRRLRQRRHAEKYQPDPAFHADFILSPELI